MPLPRPEDRPPKAAAIRQAGPADREALIDTLVRAFADDPMYTWLTAQDSRFDERYRRLFGAYLDHLAFPHGQVWATRTLRPPRCGRRRVVGNWGCGSSCASPRTGCRCWD